MTGLESVAVSAFAFVGIFIFAPLVTWLKYQNDKPIDLPPPGERECI